MLFKILLFLRFFNPSGGGLSPTYHIGYAGSFETNGSLMNLLNQTLSLYGNNITIIVDSAISVSCSDIQYKNSKIYFCPSPYLYYKWELLLTEMFKNYSHIKAVNSNSRLSSSINSPHSFSFDCPEESVVLTYGDRNCKMNTTSHLINLEASPQKCYKLAPMLLTQKVKVYSRRAFVWINNQWETVYLPCISPIYVCGYGDRPNVTDIQFRTVNTASSASEVTTKGEKYTFFRYAQNDCSMNKKDKKSTHCIFQKRIYNTTDFNLKVTSFNKTIPSCFKEKLCGRENATINICSDPIDFFRPLQNNNSTANEYESSREKNFEEKYQMLNKARQQLVAKKLMNDIVQNERKSNYIKYLCITYGIAIVMLIVVHF